MKKEGFIRNGNNEIVGVEISPCLKKPEMLLRIIERISETDKFIVIVDPTQEGFTGVHWIDPSMDGGDGFSKKRLEQLLPKIKSSKVFIVDPNKSS